MKRNTAGVILGLFIILVIPVAVVSWVYLSPKPPRIDLPILSEDSLQLELIHDSIDFSNDIKVVFISDSTQCASHLQLLKATSDTTATYPQPRPEYRELHPRILYFTNCEVDAPFYYQIKEIETSSELVLLDRLNRVRGEYEFSNTSIYKLDTDIQHLMAETYNANKKANRRMRF